jgi:WD40 repeat protein
LFNGRDLGGWKPHPGQKGNWQVQGGILVGTGADLSRLYSERGDYRDFHLRLEARYNPVCNASVLFCCQDGPVLSEEVPKGYEVPINSTHQLLAGGILADPREVEWSCWGNPSVPPGQWFTLDLIAGGDTFEVLLNGQLSAYYTEKKRSFSGGHLALQQSSPRSVIEFRKIEIKEFKSTDKPDPRELARLVGHGGRVDHVCFSPDGKRLLSSGSYHPKGHTHAGEWYLKGDDDTVRLWDSASGRNLFTTPGQLWGIRSPAFSTDGRYAASWSGWGDGDPSARQDLSVWDLAVGRRIHRLMRSDKADKDLGVARTLAFSPDGRRVLSVYVSPSIHLWDLETEKELPVIRLNAGDLVIAGAIFTSDRGRLITGSASGSVELWDVKDGKRLMAFVGHTGWTGALARSADDRLILSGGSDETLRLWDAATGQPLRIVSLKGDGAHCMAISPDGHKALTAGNYGTIRLWDLDTGHEICRLYGHRMGVNSVAFSPDGRRAVSGSDDRTVRVWKLPEAG